MKSARAVMCLAGLLIIAGSARSSWAQSSPSGPNDPQAIWNALAHPAFDPQKVASVSNLVITRDRIRIVLDSGTLHFTQPVNGIVFGAVFSGTGRLQMGPPNAIEAQQLQLFTKEGELNQQFSEAVFVFTDKTFDEIAAKVQWGGAKATNDDLLGSRIQAGEDMGGEFLPRLFKSVMGADRSKSALFLADVKTDQFGWVDALYEADRPEEVSLGRWADFGVFKFFDVWMSFPAGGRSSSEAFNIPQAQADYQIRAYDMDVRVTSTPDLTATAKMKMESEWAGERVLLFGLDSNLRVEKISNEKGASLIFIQAREQKDRIQSYGTYVAVILPEPSQSKQGMILTIQYSGKRAILSAGPGVFFPESYGWYPARMTSFTSGDEFAGRYDWDIRFRFPKKYTAIVTGNKVNENSEGNETISEWKSDVPLTVAGFAYGDFRVYTEKVGDIEIQVYANKQPDNQMASLQREAENAQVAVGQLTPASLAPTIGNEMGNALRTFIKYYGPFPYKHLAITSIPAGYGQGWPGLIYLSSLTFLDPTQLNSFRIPPNNPRLTQFFRAHEASHQWWGHRVGWKSYHDQWLSEGFAQFSGNLYTQLRDNQKEYVDRLKADKLDLLAKDDHNHVIDSVGPIWMGYRTTSSIGLRRGSSDTATIIYNKGGYVLGMLRMMLADSRSQDPDARFKSMMQDFCKTFENKAASTEDFKAIAEKHMTLAMDLGGNHKLDWFFNQYVYGTGIPHYEFHYEVKDAGNGQWNVTGLIKRSGVPEPWMDAVPLFMERNGQMVRLGLISALKTDTPISFTLPQNPGKLQINSSEELLAEIKQ
jgi:hypothetical protein